MSYPVVRPNQTAAPVVQDDPNQWTPAQMKLITDVVAKNASPDELKLFLYRCKSMGLDPLKPGMVHFIKYKAESPGVIVVGIEGFRSIAGRTGKVSGVERGVHRDESGKVVAGWCKVYRSDWTHPAHEEVPFNEYYKSTRSGDGPWDKMPATMIKKVAEAAALRMAFPDDLGGVYSQEEMDQANRNPIGGDQPDATDGMPQTEYRVNFGQFRTKSIEELLNDPKVGPVRLAKYIEYLEDPKQVAARKPELVQPVAEFIDRMSDAIASYEREIANQMRDGS